MKILEKETTNWRKDVLNKFFKSIEEERKRIGARFCKIDNITTEYNKYYIVFLMMPYQKMSNNKYRFEIKGYISYSATIQTHDYYADMTYFADELTLWIQDNYVKNPEMHNKGIGSLGMECIKELAKQLSCTKIQGKAQPRNIDDKDELQKLINFYRKNGFVYTEETRTVIFVLN